MVIQYVAENDKEVVAECMGQDESGHMITQFLVVDMVGWVIMESGPWIPSKGPGYGMVFIMGVSG